MHRGVPNVVLLARLTTERRKRSLLGSSPPRQEILKCESSEIQTKQKCFNCCEFKSAFVRFVVTKIRPWNPPPPLATPLFCPVLSIGTFFSCSSLCPSKKKTVSNLKVSYSVWKALDCLPQKRGLPVPDRKIFCLMTLNW